MVAEGGAVLERDLSVKPGKKTGLVGELGSPGTHTSLGWEIGTEKRVRGVCSWTHFVDILAGGLVELIGPGSHMAKGSAGCTRGPQEGV